jgi:hypothetical protein
MRFITALRGFGSSRGWAGELVIAVVALLAGLAVMPLLIYGAGSVLLGRYDGASVGQTYHSLYSGLISASIASWIVALGPYALYLLFKGLGAWWRGGTTLA